MRETDLSLETGPDLRDGENGGRGGRVDEGRIGVVEVYHFDVWEGGLVLREVDGGGSGAVEYEMFPKCE